MTILIEPKSYKTSIANRYLFRDSNCLGCTCFSPGERLRVYHPIIRGIKRRKDRFPRMVHVCTTRFDTGECPVENGYDEKVKEERIVDGWKTAII